MFDSLLQNTQYTGLLGYMTVLLISFAESVPFVGLITPGSTAVILFGIFSSQGYFNIWYLILFATVGAILGDGFGYYLGRKGKMLFGPKKKILNMGHLETGKHFFKKHGGAGIFLGRFIGPIRPIIPFVAGLSQMSVKNFIFWNVTSGILWALSFLGIGYFFGHAFNNLTVLIGKFGVLIVGISIVFPIIVLLFKYRERIIFLFRFGPVSVAEYILEGRIIRKLAIIHPTIHTFIKNRLNAEKLQGLPLTFTAIAVAFILFLIFE